LANYKGIPYRIEKISNGQWKWSISPTPSVVGLKAMNGTETGLLTTVTDLVKAKIDTQVHGSVNLPKAPYRFKL
jgi:hypothetical protein